MEEGDVEMEHERETETDKSTEECEAQTILDNRDGSETAELDQSEEITDREDKNEEENEDIDVEDEDKNDENEEDDDDDDGGWITPGNISKVKKEMGFENVEQTKVDVKSACLTTDFAMQVLFT